MFRTALILALAGVLVGGTLAGCKKEAPPTKPEAAPSVERGQPARPGAATTRTIVVPGFAEEDAKPQQGR